MTTSGLIKGIDVSVIQGSIPWQQVAGSGVEFSIMRCGVGNSSIDVNYKKNVAGANEVGIKTAAYNFLYPLPPLAGQPLRDPKAQAQYHYEGVANLVSVISIDLEWPTPQTWSKWNCSASQIVDWTMTYLQTYEQLSGIRPLIYSYPSFLSAIKFPVSVAQDYKLWIASYTANPVSVQPWGTNWSLWQASGGSEKLPNGIPVDIDYARDLSLWGVQAPVVQPTPPVPEINTPVPATSPAVLPTIPAPVPSQSTETAPANPEPSSPPHLPHIPTNLLPTLENIGEKLITPQNSGVFNVIQNTLVAIVKKLFHI